MLNDPRGSVIQLNSGGATAAGGTLTAVTMFSGDSNTIKSTNNNSLAWMLALWSYHNVAGDMEVYSPRMHDGAQGMRFKRLATDTTPIWLANTPQILYPVDNINYLINGSGLAVSDTLHSLIFYDDIQGSKQRLADLDTIQRFGRQFVTLRTTLTGAASGSGAYVGGVRLNTITNTLWQDTDYAWIGYAVDTEVPCIGLTGPDFSSYRIGGPGSTKHQDITREFFPYLYRRFERPCIPVFNANNAGAFTLDMGNASNAVSPVVDLLLLRLDPQASQVV